MDKSAFAYAVLGAVLAAGCGGGKISTQAGASACITATKCGILPNASACSRVVAYVNDPALTGGAKFSPEMVACLANAGADCAAAKKCLGNGQTPAPCTGSGESCNGNLYQTCTDSAGAGGGTKGTLVFDCGQLGLMCVANNGNVDCGYGTCSGGMPTCTDAKGNAGGTFVQSCKDGVIERSDCAHFGATCNPSGITGAHCRGNGPACTAPSLTNVSLRCDGSVLVSCLDGQEGRYDCGNVALGCFPNPGGTGFGCWAGSDCNPNDFTATCVGTKLTFCNMGKLDTVDCASGGFTTCDPNNGGTCR